MFEEVLSGYYLAYHPVRRQNEKRALHAKKYFVERLCDVDDCTLGPLVNEFVFAK